MKFIISAITLIILLSAMPVLQGCSMFDSVSAERDYPLDPEDARRAKRGKLTGEGGLKIFGGNDKKGAGAGGIGVNSFLWRATLDTISFMPLAQVDPHGGVILTNWFEDPDARGERFKVDALILGTDLRADGVRVSVFRQVQQADGRWQDAKVDEKTARTLEDKILTRARELRINNPS